MEQKFLFKFSASKLSRTIGCIMVEDCASDVKDFSRMSMVQMCKQQI